MKNFFKNGAILVFVLAFFLRVTLASFGTLELDFNTFVGWSVNLAQNGFRNFYNGWSDYLPGYLYVLWFLGKIRGILPDALLYKLPSILADLATGYLVYRIISDLKGKKWGLISSAIYLFNPAVWVNSTLWGQADSLPAFFAVFSIYQFPSSIFLSAVSLAIGTLIKPQAAFAFPVILFLFLKKKTKPAYLSTKFIKFGTIGLFVFLLGFLPFQNEPNFLSFVLHRLIVSFNQYPYTSVNAFNFWGIFGFWKKDSAVTQIIGYSAAFVLSLVAGKKLLKRPRAEYFFLSLIFASTFLFLTRIHERHLFPVFAPLTIAAAEVPLFLLPLVGFSITYLLNLYYSFNWVTYDFKTVFSPTAATFISVFNLALFAILIMVAVNPKLARDALVKIKGYLMNRQKKGVSFPKIRMSAKAARLFLVLILLFSFVTRIARLSNPAEMYFDEVYHAFTAKLVLHGDPKAWEWWNPHPEGFAYEWTHPPFAKLAMALGMQIFGENSFGWRVPGAVLGTLSVFLVYLLAKKIFSDELTGLLSAAVFSLDGLPLTMARIGMNDIYILFFVLLSVYCFLKEKDFWAAISFGLALSSKWSAVWTLPIIFVLWIHRKKELKASLLWFFLLPLTVYLLTYLQMFTTGHTLGTFWGMQKQMWWYHTGLKATHAYASSWISWPFMVRPVYLYTSDEIGGWVSRIYATGNPLVFWFGAISIFASAVFAFLERNKKLGLIVFSYLIFFVPWAASPRVMFIYHYLPSLPFLAIAAGYILRRFPKTIVYFLVPSALLYIYFFPHWAGLKAPLWLDASYYWFSSWR